MIHIKRSYQPPEQLPLTEVNRQLAAGQLKGDELAWQQGMSEWQPLVSILGVISQVPPPLPPEPRSNISSPRTAVQQKPATRQTSLKPPTEELQDEESKGFMGVIRKGAAVLVLCGGLISLWNDYSFVLAASTTNGTLTSTPTRHSAGGRKHPHTEYYVDYAFAVGGRSYTGRDSIHYYPSSHVTVYYERANPFNNKAEYPETWAGWGLSILGGYMTVVLFRPWKSFQRNRNIRH